MGFFDRFRGSAPQHQEPGPAGGVVAGQPAPARPQSTTLRQVAPQVPAASQPTIWIPAGQPTTVAGYPIPGGLIYVGRHLTAPNGRTEPALIDPTLRIDRNRPDWDGIGLDYWPSYGTLPASSRAAYLTWLADGRRYGAAPIGYVFLFFYGLERRVLVDISNDRALRREIPAIAAEVRRLLKIYGANNSFRSYASSFLQVLELIGAAESDGSEGRPPELAPDRWPIPMQLRLALGEFAASGTPVPAGWARAWAWYLPSLYPRTPQTRCPEEFDRLFVRRYAERFKDGFRVRPGKARIEVIYRAASGGIASASARLDLPDVVELAGPARKLTELVESVTDDLDAYSRRLGRDPDGRGSLAAAALLPPELLDQQAGQVGALRAWCDARLANETDVLVDAAELIAFWPTAQTGKMTKAEAVSLAQLLGRLGVGVEPDVRLGGSPLPAGPAVLFRTTADAPHTATPAYTAAATLLHLAVAVSASDGTVSDHEQHHLTAHLQAALHLTAPERARLQAHQRWLAVTGVKLTGLKKRLDLLRADQRETIGDFLITVAAADGVISPEEVTSLTKIYKLLGLDPNLIYGRLHQQVTGPAALVATPPPAAGPVVVRPAGPAPAGYTLPTAPPAAHRASTQGNGQRVSPPASGVVLDEDVIAAKLAETAAVSALLSTIFTDEEGPAPQPAAMPAARHDEPKAEPTTQALIPGLDAVHSELLRSLAAHPTWTRAAYEDLAERHGVMPAGALDLLNEVAMDAAGEPVAEGDDDVVINDYALQELLR
ncbi:TerB N-terminal domain-containing protein [Micromonospora sp. NPDC023966]|uniref:tellurite resistance TerB family protein n=1 Tax=Micromonospora sp. NPDC023966 TaxID=3154699 RepID=UPI0033C58895